MCVCLQVRSVFISFSILATQRRARPGKGSNFVAFCSGMRAVNRTAFLAGKIRLCVAPGVLRLPACSGFLSYAGTGEMIRETNLLFWRENARPLRRVNALDISTVGA